MPLDIPLIAALLALGCGGGFLAGLLGVGGGMVMVPFLTTLLQARGIDGALSVKMAIATSMCTIAFTSLSSVRAHHRRGAVRWDLVRSLAPGIVIGGLIGGAGVFARIQGAWLGVMFALFVGFSATRMLMPRRAAASRSLPGALGMGTVGSGIGLVSGLVGAGGAFMSVPFMSACGVVMHQAVGTSAALGFPIALANAAGYLIGGRGIDSGVPGAQGYLWLPALALIASMSVLLAPVGARAAHALDVARLKQIFAVVLYLLAGYMLLRSLTI